MAGAQGGLRATRAATRQAHALFLLSWRAPAICAHLLSGHAPSTVMGFFSCDPRLFLQVADTWDLCIENTVRKLAYGALAGGLAAMILFRTLVAPRPCEHSHRTG